MRAGPAKKSGTSKPATRRSSSKKGGGRRFSLIALTIALPLLFCLLFVGYRWLERSPTAGPVQRSAVTAAKKTSIVDRLKKAGLQVDRISTSGRETVIESTDSIETIRELMTGELGSLVAEDDGDRILIRGEGAGETVSIRPFRTIDSGAGLVESETKESLAEESDEGSTVSGNPEAVVPASLTPQRLPGAEKRIALILDDVGYDSATVARAATINARLSFAVIPGTPHATSSAELLSSRGFEVLCHLPMEPEGYPRVSPGNLAVLRSMSNERIRQLTLSNLLSIPHARGVNNHMGSRATSDRRVMTQVLSALPAGTYFIDSRTSPRSVGAETARAMKVRTASRDVFLDDDASEPAIRRQLAELVRRADVQSVAIGIGHVYPVTIRILQEEIPLLQKRGYRFVSAGEAVN